MEMDKFIEEELRGRSPDEVCTVIIYVLKPFIR